MTKSRPVGEIENARPFVAGGRLWHRDEGLRRRRYFAGNGRFRHLPVLDRIDRFAGMTVQHINETLSGSLNQSRDGNTILHDVDQRRCRIGAVVPKVVNDELTATDHLAGFDIQRCDRGAMRNFIKPGATVKARARRRDRDVEHAFLGIDRHRCPDIGGAGLGGDVFGDHFKGPAQRAGARIERKDAAGRHFGLRAFSAAPAEEQKILVYCRRLQERQRRFPVHNIPLVDIDHAVLAEIRAGFSGIGVDRMQLRIHRADIDALLTWLTAGDVVSLPIGDAAVRQLRLSQELQRRFGIVEPFHFSVARLERDDAVERRAEIDRVVDEKRRRRPNRGRECFSFAQGRAARDIAGPRAPGDLQVFHVGRRDLGEAREFLSLKVAVEMLPNSLLRSALLRRSLRMRTCCAGRQQQNCDEKIIAHGGTVALSQFQDHA